MEGLNADWFTHLRSMTHELVTLWTVGEQ